jgi:molybdate transport system substrate-binding protein
MRRCLVLVVAVALLSACNGEPPPMRNAADEIRGEITVFAAASLTDAFTDVQRVIERGHPDGSITFNFAGSQQLVQQIKNGAPADIVATADTKTMDELVAANLVEGPTTLAHNTLAIAIAPGNPKGITGLTDLARPDLTVVLADPSVPVGGYAAAALRHADVIVRPRSLELDVKAALAKVTAGEADAAIVYATDVLGSKADRVAIVDADNQFVSYPIAIVRGTPHLRAARALLIELTDGPGRAALRKRGFRV